MLTMLPFLDLSPPFVVLPLHFHCLSVSCSASPFPLWASACAGLSAPLSLSALLPPAVPAPAPAVLSVYALCSVPTRPLSVSVSAPLLLPSFSCVSSFPSAHRDIQTASVRPGLRRIATKSIADVGQASGTTAAGTSCCRAPGS